MFPMSIVYERRGRGRLAEDAERRGRVSSTPLRGYDTPPRRQVPVKSILSKSASAILREVSELCVSRRGR